MPVPGSGGSYVSAVPSMMKPDAASSATSNVCKVNEIAMVVCVAVFST